MEDLRAVAYCRVSTLEQKRRGYGIDIQIRDVTVFAERLGVFIQKLLQRRGAKRGGGEAARVTAAPAGLPARLGWDDHPAVAGPTLA